MELQDISVVILSINIDIVNNIFSTSFTVYSTPFTVTLEYINNYLYILFTRSNLIFLYFEIIYNYVPKV